VDIPLAVSDATEQPVLDNAATSSAPSAESTVNGEMSLFCAPTYPN
jgi:hypothetical protein